MEVNIGEENISQKFRLKKKEEIRNYFIKAIDQNELMSNKCIKVCTLLNYIEYFLILTSAVTGCTSISAFASLLGIHVEITSSAVGLKICAIIAGIKKYKSIIKKKKKKHDKILLLAKTNSNNRNVSISKILIDSVLVTINLFQ